MNRITFEVKVAPDHLLRLPEDLPVGSVVRVTIQPRDDRSAIRARTDIGRLALAARREYLDAGGRLLNADEIADEVHRRRGGVDDGR